MSIVLSQKKRQVIQNDIQRENSITRRFLKNKILSFGLGTGATVAVTFLAISACTGQQAKAKPNIIHKSQGPRPGVVAKIGGEEITQEMLIGNERSDFFDLEKKEYELKMNRINRLMVEKLIGAEAKKANMGLDDFIQKKITSEQVKIPDSEYKKFIADRHYPESQITPEVKEKIINFIQTLKKQDLVTSYVAKLTKNNPVEVYFEQPKMIIDVNAGDSPYAGGKNAPVTIVEFSDFQCPFCSRGADTVNQIKKKYGQQVKIAFKHFPLPGHAQARPAAEASMCVNEQGMDKFWKFHDLVFKNQDKLDKTSLEKYAKDSGADVKKFNDCLDSKKQAELVQKDVEYGEKIGIKSTPTFFVNGQLVSGALPLEAFSEMIDEELKTKKN